jgi:hypothetical protein
LHILIVSFNFCCIDGVIFINQTSIPGSNIFEVFPFLFKSHKPKTVPGLLDFVSKINEMGLNDLIVSKTSILPKVSGTKRNETNETEKWWFLN